MKCPCPQETKYVNSKHQLSMESKSQESKT